MNGADTGVFRGAEGPGRISAQAVLAEEEGFGTHVTGLISELRKINGLASSWATRQGFYMVTSK